MATTGGRVPATTGDGGLGNLIQLLQLSGRGTGGTATQTQTQSTPGSSETQTQSTSGGTDVTTMNPGDDSFLRALFGEMQGTDYQGLLQSIFQQASGQIPGFQAAFGNAVGARSGKNSAVAGMLQRLLQQTTIQGQAQVSDQMLRNQATRSNIGSAIAQNTRGTRVETRRAPQVMTTRRETPPREVQTVTNTTTPKAPNQLGDLLLLGLLGQGAKGIKGMFGEKTGGADGAAAPVTTEVNPNAGIAASGEAGINGLDFTSAEAPQQMYSNFNDTAPSFWGAAPQIIYEPMQQQQMPFDNAGWGFDMGGANFDSGPAATDAQVDNYDWGGWLDEQAGYLDDAGWGAVDGGSGFGGYQEMPVFDAEALDMWDSGGSWW